MSTIQLENTTINLRNMVKTEKSGKLQFQGVFADGLTSPGATVTYNLSDAGKNYTGQVPGSYSYKYPDTSTLFLLLKKEQPSIRTNYPTGKPLFPLQNQN